MSKKPKLTLERQRIYHRKEASWPEGTPDEIIVQMTAMKEEYSHWTELKLMYEWLGYEDCEYFVEGYTLESEEDYKIRIQDEGEELRIWEEKQAIKIEQQRIRLEEQHKALVADKLRQYEELQAALKKEGVI